MTPFAFEDGSEDLSTRSPRHAGPAFQGAAFSREVIDAVWEEAQPIQGNDPELWRKDIHGTWINRYDYAKPSSNFGWGIQETRGGTLEARHVANLSSSPGGSDEDDEGLSSQETMELF